MEVMKSYPLSAIRYPLSVIWQTGLRPARPHSPANRRNLPAGGAERVFG
jgi:hypothetical protein